MRALTTNGLWVVRVAIVGTGVGTLAGRIVTIRWCHASRPKQTRLVRTRVWFICRVQITCKVHMKFTHDQKKHHQRQLSPLHFAQDLTRLLFSLIFTLAFSPATNSTLHLAHFIFFLLVWWQGLNQNLHAEWSKWDFWHLRIICRQGGTDSSWRAARGTSPVQRGCRVRMLLIRKQSFLQARFLVDFLLEDK